MIIGMSTARENILCNIKKLGRGSAFTAKDFSDVAARGTVDVNLSRLASEGIIRRIGRGLYDNPQEGKLLGGSQTPDIDQAARAIARKPRWTIAPHGAVAANLFGLSQQIPARIAYLSDAPTRQFNVAGQMIKFQHASPKDVRAESYSSRTIIQALKCLGKSRVDREVIDHLRRALPTEEKADLARDVRYGTDWIFEIAQEIAEEGGDE